VRTPKLVKWVVQTTRQAKRHEAPAALAEGWRAEAAEHVVDVPELLRDVLGRERPATSGLAGEDQAATATNGGDLDRPLPVVRHFDWSNHLLQTYPRYPRTACAQRSNEP
jgi:hypothetical protein